jgi:hypothetical protein
MELAIIIGMAILSSVFLAVLWVKGIDYMQENYPDYEGEDLFDEDLTTKEKKPTKKNEKNKRTN